MPGFGVTGFRGEKELFGGNLKLAKERAKVPQEIEEKVAEYSKQGKTSLVFGEDDRILGVIAVADMPRPESRSAVSELRSMGVRVVMLTGDNRETASAIAAKAGIDEVIADVLPGDKAKKIEELKNDPANGRVAMAGDGINDAPALTVADLGAAIGAGTDIAIDAAAVVLVREGIYSLVRALDLGRKTLRNIRENLFWAFFYNCICIPLAAGVFIRALGWELNPMIGAAAMSLSSFCVVMNALRLNLVHKKFKEDITMRKTLKIEGMMCAHCEARVKKTLEAIDGVASADVSHEKGTAVVELSAEVDDKVLKDAVEAQDYKVVGVD
ncbi:MAG: metal-transporting ATPase [Lachnospiraceae bacterium]|nr:metal-transporting ATPase [Lachnospiraceae bacterium]